MAGTPNLDVNRNNFTEKKVDDLYELGCMTTEDMWKLREAIDIWEGALKRYRKKSQNSGATILSEKAEPAKRGTGATPKSIDPSEMIESIRNSLDLIEGRQLTGRMYSKLRTVREHLMQIVTSLNDLDKHL